MCNLAATRLIGVASNYRKSVIIIKHIHEGIVIEFTALRLASRPTVTCCVSSVKNSFLSRHLQDNSLTFLGN